MKLFLSLVIIFSFNNLFAENLKGKYLLKESKIDYLVKYLIKKADAMSTKAKGKGECDDNGCTFLIAAPIKSFESKDANRDLNMITAVKGDKFPLVSCLAKFKSIDNNKIVANLEIDFSGVKKSYNNVSLNYLKTADGFKVDGQFDLILDQHEVKKPSLLGVAIENLVPINVSATFQEQK